jgi:inhibitor of KinA
MRIAPGIAKYYLVMGLRSWFKSAIDLWVFELDSPEEAQQFANGLEEAAFEGARSVYPAFERVGVLADPLVFRAELAAKIASSLSVSQPSVDRRWSVPVYYGIGEDLDEVAATLGTSAAELIRAHSGAIYRCEALGFRPGFPYLSGLPPSLCNLPRKPTPRPSVPAGSVGIVDDLCCIYPECSPGGWNLIGRTPLQIADNERDWFPLAIGDEIQFVPVSAEEFDRLRGVRLGEWSL